MITGLERSPFENIPSNFLPCAPHPHPTKSIFPVWETDLRWRHSCVCQSGRTRQLLAPAVLPVCLLHGAAGWSDLLLPGRTDLLWQASRWEAQAPLPGLRWGDCLSRIVNMSYYKLINSSSVVGVSLKIISHNFIVPSLNIDCCISSCFLSPHFLLCLDCKLANEGKKISRNHCNLLI